jgi:hypothetical protein
METKSDVDPWDRVKEWYKPDEESESRTASLKVLEEVELAIGKHPVPSIEHVPEKDLLYYATRDSDACLRLFLFLQNYTPWIFY